MKSTGRTSSKAVGNASPPGSDGALNEGGAQTRRATPRRKIGILFTSCVVPAASAVAALHLAGCWPLSYSERCEDDARYCTPDGTGGGGGTTQPDPTCDVDPTQDPSAVRDQCAVFARAGAAARGDGTKARPYASLADAIENANGKRVLACTSGEFKGSVTVGVAAEVIGGFDCDADWTWSAEAQSIIEGDANKAALTLTKGASGAKLRSFKIVAADATEAGGSSIGVAVDDIDAELSSVAVVAGNGMDGARGETPTAGSDGARAPDDVSNACVGTVYGGLPGATTCEDGETSGGVGGLGGMPATDGGNGQKGQDGAPLPTENPDGNGLGGAGQAVAQSNCARGKDGVPGARGNSGDPGIETTLTLAGPTGGNGTSGMSGVRGQGGGGGGGAKAGQFCAAGGGTFADGVGASGGGGGAGGCGGKAGTGGKAGGSSIGILSLGTSLVLTDVTVAVGKAGNGGTGGDGSPGGLGGMGANGGARVQVSGSIQGCAGGMGGAGGDGGPGAGGRGGHAVGIAYSVTPSQAPALSVLEGTAGAGGAVGREGPATSNGAPGVSGACWDFGAKTSCPQQ
ncbi:hypothetical protein WME76_14825 [Sorangium sp. So ce119]|uniref:hypothetical protein n=1 Tax=Sorangium sp. So ce119 TaxID=3133279 RepID=UPI003F61A040